MAATRFKLSALEILSVGLVDKPCVAGAKFVMIKREREEELNADQIAELDRIIEKFTPHEPELDTRTPAPNAVSQHELARVAAYMGR